jgi:hypothetical protein
MVPFITVRYKTVCYKKIQRYIKVSGTKWYTTKRYNYKTVHVTKLYIVTKQHSAEWYVTKRDSIIIMKYLKVKLHPRGIPRPTRYSTPTRSSYNYELLYTHGTAIPLR